MDRGYLIMPDSSTPDNTPGLAPCARCTMTKAMHPTPYCKKYRDPNVPDSPTTNVASGDVTHKRHPELSSYAPIEGGLKIEHIPGRPIGPSDDVVISTEELLAWRDEAVTKALVKELTDLSWVADDEEWSHILEIYVRGRLADLTKGETDGHTI
jgi:hypothetical protein